MIPDYHEDNYGNRIAVNSTVAYVLGGVKGNPARIKMGLVRRLTPKKIAVSPYNNQTKEYFSDKLTDSAWPDRCVVFKP